VIEEFHKQDILSDIWDLIADRVPDEELDAVEEVRERFSALCEKVEWGELFNREMIYAGRFTPSSIQYGSPYEGLLIGRMDKKRAADNYKALQEVMKEVVKLGQAEEGGPQDIILTESKIEGMNVTAIGPHSVPQMISIGHKKDLIVVSLFNRTILQEGLTLLKGESTKKGLIETERFRKAFKELPPPEDTLVFFDVSRLFCSMGDLLRSLAPPSPTTGKATGDSDDQAGNESGAALPGLICTIMNDLAIVDYVASVEWTDGYRVFHEDIAALGAGAKSKPLFSILEGGSPITDFEKYIPKEASNFSCTTGVDFVAAYRYLLSLMRDNLPGAKSYITELEILQRDQWELDIEKDVLGLFDGNFTFVTIGKDTVVMAKVTDEVKVSSLINRLVTALSNRLGEEQPLMISKVDVAGEEGFIQVSHPLMLMMGGMRPPVIGTANGYVFLGASADSVALCLDTARGKHPNITKNKRWKKEAIIPKARKLDSISFTDERNLGTELQTMIGGVTLAFGMVGMMAQDLPPELREALTTITPLVAKLGPVAAKLDFYQSSADYTTFDGKQWHTRGVQNYKKPRPKPASEDKPAEEKADKKKDAEKPREPTEI
jgi:hypothetical protein